MVPSLILFYAAGLMAGGSGLDPVILDDTGHLGCGGARDCRHS